MRVRRLRAPLVALVLAAAGLAKPPHAAVARHAGCAAGSLPAMTADRSRAMWLWDSAPVVASDDRRDALFALCRCARVDTLWMQVALERERAPDGAARLARAADWRRFLRAAHEAGFAVEALDGSPTHALRRFHGEPLAVVDAIVAFNGSAAKAERFDGLQFDIEPHALYRWRFAAHRERMLGELLELVLEARQRLRARPELRFGMALPFWLQAPVEGTGLPIGLVTVDGVRKAASYHLIDRLDYVAVMSYRDRTAGPNGLVAISRDILDYAERARGAAVYLGLETAAGSQRVWFATGLPRATALARLDEHGEDPDLLEPIDGFRRSLFDDGTRLHPGLRVPDDVPLDDPRLVAAMRVLAARYGLGPGEPDGPGHAGASALSHALGAMARDIEWRIEGPRPIPAGGGEVRSGFVGRAVTPESITFAGQPPGDLAIEIARAQQELRGRRAFAGFALHDYEHLVRLLDRPR